MSFGIIARLVIYMDGCMNHEAVATILVVEHRSVFITVFLVERRICGRYGVMSFLLSDSDTLNHETRSFQLETSFLPERFVVGLVGKGQQFAVATAVAVGREAIGGAVGVEGEKAADFLRAVAVGGGEMARQTAAGGLDGCAEDGEAGWE